MKIFSKIHYNSPVVLTFFIVSLISLALGYVTGGWTTMKFFSVYRSSMSDPYSIVRLFLHVLGHADYSHFTSNMVLLLVIGPALEEKYGSKTLLFGIMFTALISGLFQSLFFPGSALLGSSGIVFMMIMLSSLSGMKTGYIPLTLILVSVLYLGQELYAAFFVNDNVAHFIHIVGGSCGTALGYMIDSRNVRKNS